MLQAGKRKRSILKDSATSPTAPPQARSADIVMSCFNEERYIDRCLVAVREQDGSILKRVVIVDGGSTDGTVEIIRRHAAEDSRIVLIADGVRRNLPSALSVGLEYCSADLVAKVDAHGYPEPDFLRNAVAAFAAGGPDIACVGGRPEQHGETPFGEAVACARTSRFGVGGSEYAGGSQQARVDTVQCGVYRRDVLERVGGFDPEMNFGEDDELNWRIRQAGFGILLDNRIRFHYIARPTWRAAYRQYRNYGAARIRVVRRHPGFLRLYHLAPAVLVAGTGALIVLAPFSRRSRNALAAIVGMWTAGALVSAGRAAGNHPVRLLRTAACFGALHAGYGIGMLRELSRPVAQRTRNLR